MAEIGAADLLGDLGEHLDQHLQHRGVVVVRERLGALVHRLGLGLPDREDRGGLGLTLGAGRVGLRRTTGPLGLAAAGALDRLGLGERGTAGLLGLTGEAGLLRLGLGGRDGGRLARLGGGDLGGPLGLGLLLDAVAVGVGGLADLGLELALGQRRLTHGDLLLLRRGSPGRGRPGPAARRRRPAPEAASVSALISACFSASARLDDGDLLLGLDPGLLGLLPGVGLGDRRGLADPGGLGTTEVGEVGAVVGDVLDLEGVEDQALAGQRVLGLVGDPLGEGRPVADDLLDGQAADDRAQRTGQDLLGERLDVAPAGSGSAGPRAGSGRRCRRP